MSLPDQLDLTLYDWSSARHRVHVRDEAGKAQDLSNYTAVMQLRDEPGGTQLLVLSEGSGLQTHAEGYIDIVFDGDELGPADWQSALYDLWLIDAVTQDRYAIATGTILVEPSVATFNV